MSDEGLVDRLDRLERELEGMRRELDTIRSLAVTTPASAPVEPIVVAPVELVDVAPAALVGAWRALERGSASAALDLAFEAVRIARVDGDLAALDEIVAFAAVAVAETEGRQRDRAHQLAARIELAQSELLAVPGAEPAVRPAPTATPRQPAPAPTRPREPQPVPALERLTAWLQAELTGARLFAVVGGVVTLLGVIFLFVLAANRGWVGPGERVTLGAAASLAVLLAGVALRLRYGRVNAALGAVGAGLAGAYATLAAATILYGYLPSWGALLFAAGIAAVGAWIAIT